jgi:hypothetical protein
MRFRDRKHQLAVQAAERNDAGAQALINEFCELINFPYQQQQGLFAVGFYQSVLPVSMRPPTSAAGQQDASTATEETSTDASSDEVSAETVVPDEVPADASDAADLGGDDTASDEPSERQNA